MQKLLKATLSMVLFCLLPSLASANIIYNVSRTIGSGSVTGFIETDGTLGTLSNANLVDWELTLASPNLAGGSPAVIRKSNPNGTAYGISGTAVSATVTDLYYDFAVNSHYFILYSTNDASTSDNWWCLVGGNLSCVGEPTPAETIGYGVLGSFAETHVMQTGMVSIASTTSVPEPVSLALLGLGLLGLGFSRRK